MMRAVRLTSLAIGAALAVASASAASSTADITGKQLYKYCKSCHGTGGEGGKEGTYPRLAGLPQEYLERQLHNFKGRKRLNKPMIPIFEDYRFNDELITRVAQYISRMSEPNLNLWPYSPSEKALAEFDSRSEFNDLGEEIFQRDCAQCHGEDARGRKDKHTPPLVNQYPSYLGKQIGDFVAGSREHEHSTKMFGELYPEEREAVFNYLVELGK